jgi:hypothetical protein
LRKRRYLTSTRHRLMPTYDSPSTGAGRHWLEASLSSIPLQWSE